MEVGSIKLGHENDGEISLKMGGMPGMIIKHGWEAHYKWRLSSLGRSSNFNGEFFRPCLTPGE
jgi:hypothetical protein